MNKKTGNIQLSFHAGVIKPRHYDTVITFKGWVDLLKKIVKSYKSGCYRMIIFFDDKK